VERDPRGISLCVEDSGPGLAAEHIARLGQRFFRVTGTEGTGSGLGWSIMRRIAAAHGASLQAEASGRLGGLLARVVFAPAAPH
jgi:two-component system sensor histidine kinase QseC